MVVHAADRMGNLCQKGGDTLEATEPSGHVVCVASDLGNGRYEIDWRAEVTGSYYMHITIAGSHVCGSPLEVVMLPANPDAEQCEVVGTGLHRALAGRHAHFRVKSKDIFGNSTLPDLNMVFGLCIVPAVLQSSEATEHLNDGSEPQQPQAQCNYTDEEIYGVTTKAAIERKAAAAAAAAAETMPPKATLDEAVVEDGPVASRTEQDKKLDEKKLKGRRPSIKTGESPLLADPLTAAPASAMPATSVTASKNGPRPKGKKDKDAGGGKAEKKAAEEAAAAAAAAATEKKRLEDEAMKKAEAAARAIEAKRASVPSLTFEGVWRAGGEYEIRYMSKEAGSFALHVWCDVEGNGERQRLPGSPFTMYVTAAPPSSNGSVIGGTDKASYFAGENVMLTPQLRDAFGNRTTILDHARQWSTSATPSTSIMRELITQHGGLLTHTSGLEQQDSSASAQDAPKSGVQQKGRELFGGGSMRRGAFASPVRDKPAVFEMDSWLITPGNDKVSLPLKMSETTMGMYEVDDYTLTISGQYEAHFALNGTPISGSPVIFQVAAAAPSGKRSYVTTPEQPALVKLPYELLLHTVDRFGNICGIGGARVEGKVVGGSSSACTVVDRKDGTYSLHFTVNAIGSYNVEVRIEGVKVKGSPPNMQGNESARANDKKGARRLKPTKARRVSATEDSVNPDGDAVPDEMGGNTPQGAAASATKKRTGNAFMPRSKNANAVRGADGDASIFGATSYEPSGNDNLNTSSTAIPKGPPMDLTDFTATI